MPLVGETTLDMSVPTHELLQLAHFRKYVEDTFHAVLSCCVKEVTWQKLCINRVGAGVDRCIRYEFDLLAGTVPHDLPNFASRSENYTGYQLTVSGMLVLPLRADTQAYPTYPTFETAKKVCQSWVAGAQ